VEGQGRSISCLAAWVAIAMQLVDGEAAALILSESNPELARDLVPVLAAVPYIRGSCFV
jgi:hypothetical protein